MSLEAVSYAVASHEFENAWNDGLSASERARSAVEKMLKALELEKMTRTQAIKKIVEDHKHLEGFSRTTIYSRYLSEEDKRPYAKPKLAAATNVQPRTFEESPQTSPTHAKITYTESAEVKIPEPKPVILEAQTIPELESKVAIEAKAVAEQIAPKPVPAPSVPYDIFISAERMFALDHKWRDAIRSHVGVYASVLHEEIIGFESVSERRNRKVMELRA
ncbi:MAG: hypothetical protein ACRD5H_16645 [Nitrososphaerales archaeon]